ncbi:MAG: zinc ribbon domain-containing protein [Gemmataceae bacterium]
MPATKVTCPHCGKHLKSSKPLQTGQRVHCSRCGHSFAVPADNAVGAGKVSPQTAPAVGHEATPTSPPLPPVPIEKAPHGEMPKPVSNRQVLWLGLVLGGLLFLFITTVSLVLYFGLHKGPADSPVEAADSAPSDDGNTNASNPRADVSPPPPPPDEARPVEPSLLPDPALVPKAIPEPRQASWLPLENQEQVNKAIDRGVEWLKKCQDADGAWGGRVGLAALPALTLLECGLAADDIRIQKALHHVRMAIPTLNTTYDLALAILFLDRLGDPADKKLIQTCALRLAAGQMASGGWTYDCPILSPEQEDDLLTVMRARRPKDALDLFVGGTAGSAPPGFVARDPNDSLSKDISGAPSEDSKLLPEGGKIPLDGPGSNGKPLEEARPSPEVAQRAFDGLPPQLQKLPCLQPPRQSHKLLRQDNSDNSNTQFAILGLSAAHRHKLPLDRSLALIVQRFHTSQLPNGRWNYHFNKRWQDQWSPAMTGAGLLGLAVGLGLAADHMVPRAKPRQVKDASIEKGFAFLAESIGNPLGAKRPRPRRDEQVNYYFLWSVERCGVLYNRREIDGKDWYSWGVELLLDHQTREGSWIAGDYPGSLAIADTCFALLFLKRANLAKELTKKLEFFMEGKKLQRSP